MFTGIVEELGTVRAVTPNDGGARIEIAADAGARRRRARRVDRGQRLLPHRGRAARRLVGGRRRHRDPRPHRRSARCAPGDPVNLERPVRLADRLGGHVVQGHVDGVGTVRARTPLPDGSTRMTFDAPARRPALRRREGLDHRRRRQPHRRRPRRRRRRSTSRSSRTPSPSPPWAPGSRAIRVNLEVDVLAKYVERLLTSHVSE